MAATEKASVPLPFREVAADLGIGFLHDSGARGEKLLPETMGGGVALFDFDDDGDLDLLLVNGAPFDGAAEPPPRATLYRRDGERYVEWTSAAGLNLVGHGMAAVPADLDGDGWTDLLVTGVGRDWLLRNDGGRFVEVASGLGGAPTGWSSGAASADLDDDGDLDLVVLRYLDWSVEKDRALDRHLAPGIRGYSRPQQWAGAQPLLLINQGGLRFTEEAQERGLWVTDPHGAPLGKGLAVLPFDVEGDGDVDLIVANDTERNFLFVNQGEGRFEELAELYGVSWDEHGQATGAMGLDVGDLGHGRLSIAVGNFANEPSSLFTASEDPTFFVDRASWIGVAARTRTPLAFAVLFADFDLDGRLDLLQVNGHLEKEVEALTPRHDYRQAPQLLWNAAPGEDAFLLELSPSSMGDLSRPIVGRGAAYGDLDGDGDLDLVLTQIDAPPLVLRNDLAGQPHWLRLRLRGAPPNRDAIGAIASLRSPLGSQRRFVQPSRGYLSAVEATLSFGLGDQGALEMAVTWPGGRRQRWVAPPFDRCAILVEPQPPGQ